MSHQYLLLHPLLLKRLLLLITSRNCVGSRKICLTPRFIIILQLPISLIWLILLAAPFAFFPLQIWLVLKLRASLFLLVSRDRLIQGHYTTGKRYDSQRAWQYCHQRQPSSTFDRNLRTLPVRAMMFQNSIRNKAHSGEYLDQGNA